MMSTALAERPEQVKDPRKQTMLEDRPTTDAKDEVMYDPSMFLPERSLNRLLRDPFVKQRSATLYVPDAIRELIQSQSTEALRSSAWRFFSGSAVPASPRDVLNFIESYTEPYSARNRDATARLRLENALRRREMEDEFLVASLEQEFTYLSSHSIVLGRSKRTFDALMKAGAVGVQVMEDHLPESVRAKVREWGWERT